MQEDLKMKITAIKYSATMQRIYELESLEEIPALQEENFVLWIDITEPTIKEKWRKLKTHISSV